MDHVKKWMEAHAFSGIASFKQHQKITSVFHGFQDIKHQILINEETRFGIASGTKFFTALTILNLYDKKHLDLEDSYTKYLDKAYHLYDASVTIKHLLTHTSGIIDYYDAISEKEKSIIPWQTLLNPKDYLPYFINAPLKFKPGSSFDYNNTAFILLAAIIESIEGDYYEAIQKYVIKKADLSHTGFYLFDDLPQNTATGYLKDTTIPNKDYLPMRGSGDGGIYANVSDMHHLWHAFINGDIILKKTVEEMLKPHAKEEDTFYGLGVWLKKEGNTYHPFINGYDKGVSFESLFDLNTNTSYVVISNNEGDSRYLINQIEISKPLKK